MKKNGKNQLCSKINRKCDQCKAISCRKRLDKIEEYNKNIKDIKIKNIITQLPLKCQKCNMFKITDIEKEKIYCPYMIGNICAIK